eukprot:3091718-Prymnesium_polylepis.1
MASRQSSRTLGPGMASSRLSWITHAHVAESDADVPLAAVHDGADTVPSSAFESPGPEAGIKRQRILDGSTGQDGAAPDGDDAAPQEKLSDGAVPRSQLACRATWRDAADIMAKVVESVVQAGGIYPTITAEVPIVEGLTDGLLVLAWEALEAAAREHHREYTGVQVKQMLAMVVAAAWHGAAAVERLDRVDDDVDKAKVGKRLHKQALAIQKQLKDISSKAARERAGLPAGSEEQTRSEEREQHALMDLKRKPHSGIAELQGSSEAADVEAAAPAEAAISLPLAAD